MTEKQKLGDLNGKWLLLVKLSVAVYSIIIPIVLAAAGRAWTVADRHEVRISGLETQLRADEVDLNRNTYLLNLEGPIDARLRRIEDKLQVTLQKLVAIEAKLNDHGQ